jgi:hypothetical protein
MSTPERSIQQRIDALKKANEIRIRRAKLKQELKAGEASVLPLLQQPPHWLETMKVIELLMAVPKFGQVKVNRILKQCFISSSKTVGGLSKRQRSELVSYFQH